MKKIIGLGIAVAVVIALVTTGTFAVFSDTETSSPNTFQAGIIDLEVDCAGDTTFSAQDDPLPEIFNYLPANDGDIKPGDFGEVTLSLHLKADTNDADLWMQVLSLVNDGGVCSEPECDAESGTWNGSCSNNTPDDDIADDIEVLLWLDMDDTSPAVPGDNIYQDGETILFGSVTPGSEKTLTDLYNYGELTVKDGAVACTIYYVGWSWELYDVGNEHQGDKCTFDIKFGADQITS